MEKKIGVYICSGWGSARASTSRSWSARRRTRGARSSRPRLHVRRRRQRAARGRHRQRGRQHEVIRRLLGARDDRRLPRRRADPRARQPARARRVEPRAERRTHPDPRRRLPPDGIVRVQKTSPPEPNIQEISKVILVVGGGLTGISAALDAAEPAPRSCCSRSSSKLGGWLAGAWKDLPSTAPYRDLETRRSREGPLARANAKIRIITGASHREDHRAPGLFDATVKTDAARRRSASARSCSPRPRAPTTPRSSRTSASAPART